MLIKPRQEGAIAHPGPRDRLCKEGLAGRWVVTYGHRLKPRYWWPWRAGKARYQEHVPIPHGVHERLQRIADAKGGSHGGCPDLVLWQAERLLFVESKRRSKDRIRPTQVRWLEAALGCGKRMQEYVVVVWEHTKGLYHHP